MGGAVLQVIKKDLKKKLVKEPKIFSLSMFQIIYIF